MINFFEQRLTNGQLPKMSDYNIIKLLEGY